MSSILYPSDYSHFAGNDLPLIFHNPAYKYSYSRYFSPMYLELQGYVFSIHNINFFRQEFQVFSVFL
ncbi:hypothetical protein RUMHYD_02674 [Blautia hydrogenotrophica DSM 10507]|uniref:Uncharacterized protein n=1 Tax=Blautia hydrogenotrophica (strain DSM 10507 / JCM 14656 / S5a33) TaxID=476272 RepID=C0CP72_BLAHS|nr:hypothetical protein RUMHYD_02674 [Blautia hydrogenotrophica DSM 10507]